MSHFQVQVLAVIGDKTCVTELYTKNGRLHGVGNLTPFVQPPHEDDDEGGLSIGVLGIRSTDLPEGLTLSALYDALRDAIDEEKGVSA